MADKLESMINPIFEFVSKSLKEQKKANINVKRAEYDLKTIETTKPQLFEMFKALRDVELLSQQTGGPTAAETLATQTWK